MHHDTPTSSRPHNSRDGGPGTKSNPIQSQAKYVYLGVTFRDDLSFESHMRDTVVPNVQAARAQLYPYNATSEGLDIGTCAMMVRALVESQLRYGAPIWAPDPSAGDKWVRKWSSNATTVAKAVKAHTTAVRTALGAHCRAKRDGCHHEQQLRTAEVAHLETCVAAARDQARPVRRPRPHLHAASVDQAPHPVIRHREEHCVSIRHALANQ